MDASDFWAIVERAGRDASALHRLLDGLDHDELVAFERLHESLLDAAYTWGVWGAAYLRFGGCGGDAFADFRAYLISRGRQTYEQVLAQPDTLAYVDVGDTENEWENWSSPTVPVVHARTGEREFAGPPNPDRTRPKEPTGIAWDEDELPARFPKIAARVA